MYEILRRWSVVIMVAGVAIFNRGFDSDLPLLAAVGVIIAVIGLVFLVYRRWFHLGWLAAVAGVSMIALGLADQSAILGNPIETPNVPLAVAGAVVAGLAFTALSYAVYRRASQSGHALADAG